ncbi:MAG: hypothetical protein VYE77_08470 [Planctomycetota bacterium]|nr:hypothetical protein [Planctomycetota bacterium]
MANTPPHSAEATSDSDSSSPVVATIATTPDHAKVLAALLQAEGIPAHIDGQGLADEFAIPQRLMNTQGVRVLVPAGSLESAQDILQNSEVDEAELTAQALAAGPTDPEAAQPAPPGRFAWLFQPWMILVYLTLPGLLAWLFWGTT